MGKLRLLFFIFVMVGSSSCATAIRGTKETMVVSTEPAGAQVKTSVETVLSKRARRANPALERVYYGCDATPCEFDVPRQAAFLLRIIMNDRAPVIIRVDERYAKTAINANLSTTASSSAAMVGVQAASYSMGAGASAGMAGAGFLAAGFGFVGLSFDASMGALTDVGPNPIHIVVPPAGMMQPIYIEAAAVEAAAADAFSQGRAQ